MSGARDEAATALLGRLEALDAAQREPLRFHHIRGLLTRAAERRPAVQQRLHQRAAALGRELEQRLADAGPAPDADPQRDRAARRRPPRRQRDRLEALAALGAQLARRNAPATEVAEDASLAERLHAEEQRQLNHWADRTGQPPPLADNHPHELHAARGFRDAMLKLAADRLVNQSIAGEPEDAGPLNPQRLMTRSLASMRDISPHYLSRFVAYVDTLFWLEDADPEPKR